MGLKCPFCTYINLINIKTCRLCGLKIEYWQYCVGRNEAHKKPVVKYTPRNPNASWNLPK